MNYISLFSGIEAASCAWEPLGFTPVAFSEVEPFPCALLKERFPSVPNLGDITQIDWTKFYGTDIVVGGSPCQGFSAAGIRLGLADPRSRLAGEFVRAVEQIKPRIFVWENVVGVLSAHGGEDFRGFTRALSDCGYCVWWRVLDASEVRTSRFPRAVPQKRRRVFLVGCAYADTLWRILFDPKGSRWNVETCGTKRQTIAAGTEMLVYENHGIDGRYRRLSCFPTLPAYAGTGGNNLPLVFDDLGVRYLTVEECEKLMGFPYGWTDVPFRGKTPPKSARLKALGNSMAVNCMDWLGRRIGAVMEPQNE